MAVSHVHCVLDTHGFGRGARQPQRFCQKPTPPIYNDNSPIFCYTNKMAPPTNQEANEKKEADCFAVTAERKYYHVGQSMVKRSLRPGEWQQHNGYMHIPTFNLERILNEGACIQFLSENTDIPLPKLHACFEDDGAAYIITEYVEGKGMHELDAGQQEIVAKELVKHLETLRGLKSSVWGGPGGRVSLFAKEPAATANQCRCCRRIAL